MLTQRSQDDALGREVLEEGACIPPRSIARYELLGDLESLLEALLTAIAKAPAPQRTQLEFDRA